MNARWLILAAVSGVAVAVVPALAADQSVTATRSNTWSPSSVTVTVGETVHFSNSDDGTHDLRFEGEPSRVTPLSTSWTYDRTFTAAGTFGFVCTVHNGMTGTVIVKESSTSTTQTTTTAPTTTTTAPTTTTPSTTTPDGSATPVFSVKLKGTRFCAGPDCPYPGVRLRVTLSAAATVRGVLIRRENGTYRRFGRVRFAGKQGTHTKRIARTTTGRRIIPGRYRLRLRALDLPAQVRFTVRSS